MLKAWKRLAPIPSIYSIAMSPPFISGLITKTLRLLSSKYRRSWPLPPTRNQQEPTVVFLITPQYSGSTALAKTLETGPEVGILQERAEGQWLIPGMCGSTRWNPDKFIDYHSVRQVWMHEFEKLRKANPQITTFVEKSPPNINRHDRLVQVFPKNISIANNRNPYAYCASILKRQGDDSRKDKSVFLAKTSKDWIARSLTIQNLILKQQIPLITYEKFCEDPGALAFAIKKNFNIDLNLNLNVKISVKGGQLEPIINRNESQISELTMLDIETINKQLTARPDILDFFGYSLISP